MRLSIPEFNVREFDWEGRGGGQEISTLTQGGRKRLMGRVWDDACDEGFLVGQLLFTLSAIRRNPEDEILGWEFVGPMGTNLKIIVWND